MSTKVSLRLTHPSMDLTDIANAVGLPIARIWVAGKDRKTPRDEPLEGVYQGSYCAFKVVTTVGGIPAAIASIDTALRGAVSTYALLRGLEVEKILFCTLMNEGEIIDCESLGRLVEWGIRLEIDGRSTA